MVQQSRDMQQPLGHTNEQRSLRRDIGDLPTPLRQEKPAWKQVLGIGAPEHTLTLDSQYRIMSVGGHGRAQLRRKGEELLRAFDTSPIMGSIGMRLEHVLKEIANSENFADGKIPGDLKARPHLDYESLASEYMMTLAVPQTLTDGLSKGNYTAAIVARFRDPGDSKYGFRYVGKTEEGLPILEDDNSSVQFALRLFKK